MPSPLPAAGVCPLGTVPIQNPDGSISCWDPTEPGYPGPPGGGQKGSPNPNFPGRPAPFPQPTRPKPPQPVGTGRQEGAPSIPFNPPGRIGLWGGPIFNSGSSGASTFASSTAGAITGAIAGEGPIFVNVQNQTNLADNSASTAVDNVAAAIQSAIGNSTEQSGAVIQGVVSSLLGSLIGTNGDITQGIDTAFGSLHDVISGVIDEVKGTLGGIGTQIGNSLFNSLNPVASAIAVLLSKITSQIGGLSGAIASAIAVIIPRIVQAVSDPIGALKGVLIAIENDIGGNLRSLVQIPGAIADAATSLDATLGRRLGDYERWYGAFTEAQTGYPADGNLHSDLSDVAKAIAGLVTTLHGQATNKLSDRIDTKCASVDIQKLLQYGADFDDDRYGPFKFFIKAFWDWSVTVMKVVPVAFKYWEEVRISADQSCPNERLSPGAIVDATLRGFLTQTQAQSEAAQGNLNADRLKVLQDLATHQMSPAEIVEALFRGAISQSDYSSALQAQGWTVGQQDLLRAIQTALLPLASLYELFRRGLIDKPTLDESLKTLHFDEAQRKALIQLSFRPANFEEAVSGDSSRNALVQLGLGNEADPNSIPEFIQSAAAAEGLDVQATAARWQSHWNLGGLTTWIDLYFRGQVTLDSLKAIFRKNFVPDAVIDVFIEGSRPLVQFRTISTMLHLQIISEAEARILLKQHGYSDPSVDVLIKYAQRPGTVKAAKNAAAQHSVALSIAKEEYVDGSISGDQFLAILTQHGFTLDGANTEIQVVDAHQAFLRRKEQAQLVVDEYGAGLINETSALAQLAILGLTVPELARAAHKIRAFRAKTAKHPSESELNHFLQLSIISPDDYKAELVAQGYANKWADSFLAWRTHPSSTASAGSSSH